MDDGDIDRQLAAQLAERASRYRAIEVDELDADEVDELLLPPQQGSGSGVKFFGAARDAANRVRRSLSVELEREGAITASGPQAASGQDRVPPILESNEEEDERCCRMCLGADDETADDGSSLGPLIAPCACKGSVKVSSLPKCGGSTI